MRFRPLLEKMLRPNPKDRPDSMAAVGAWPLGSSERRFGFIGSPRLPAGEPQAPASGGPARRYAVAALLLLGLLGGASVGYHRYAARPGDKAAAPNPGFDARGDAIAAAALSRADRIKRFIGQYDGGDCFLVTPVAIGEAAATLEGFGASSRPFEMLDAAFRRDQGFEPSIGVRQITPAQCPAITFLNRLRGEHARALHLQIDAVRLRNGETLSGTIDGIGYRNIELLIVSDGGTVQNISHLLKPGPDAQTFTIGMRREGLSGAQPQLLIAIATVKPLESLRPAGPQEAGQFFTAVLAEAERTRQVVAGTARYFKLEN